MITVVSRHWHKPKEGETDYYVGRGTPLGNPFSHLEGAKAQFRVGSRDEAVDCYAAWLRQKLADKDPDVCGEMNRIFSLAKEGPVNLLCYCAPQRCHAGVIKELIESKL
ncbi:DUF4326 domain-containing protein [Hymenobacter latericus]|uniref:DUF4326 domain-containing protein n=1 Tax=Hymenobacter sp. YIM 151858-1 TaxID=2987688 RepID=UPI002227E883|nr:DUF4326 domain-containing protein [Hymenobacter sp. YIM 151858-1]UYZ60119.1 DUF4326 domain-containing protein [Hymenobacter sp. YIM 151858-1]